MSPAYVPDAGDIVWLTIDPQAGREQAGRRPALAVSPRVYNEKTGLALVCPITNQTKGYPFEVTLPGGLGATGVILSDHLKNVDWGARKAVRIAICPAATIGEVLAKLAPLLVY